MSISESDNLNIKIDEFKMSDGFYLCRNQNQLDKILKGLGVNKRASKNRQKSKIEVNIKSYPCIITIKDLSFLGPKHVGVYSIDVDTLVDILDILQDKRAEKEKLRLETALA